MGKTGFFASFNDWSFVALDVSSHSFNICDIRQLVNIVSNPLVSYFDTVDIRPWYSISAHLTLVVTGSFSPRVLIVYKLYLVSIMPDVMEIDIGRALGLDLTIFLINSMDWNAYP